jgi:hypothetical protein
MIIAVYFRLATARAINDAGSEGPNAFSSMFAAFDSCIPTKRSTVPDRPGWLQR